jgi:LmbE family N-acetylglucosaminyl deacetylase
MGEVRYKEMLAVEEILGLSGMTVLDFPDSGLKELDPRLLEQAVKSHVESLRPDVVVTHPVHGISGFHDHIVTHAVVKRVYLELRDAGAPRAGPGSTQGVRCPGSPRRLAFVTLPDSGKPTWTEDGSARLKLTEEALIDCVVRLEPDDVAAMRNALACYATYKDIIDKVGVVEKIGDRLYFEFFGENFTPPLSELTERM